MIKKLYDTVTDLEREYQTNELEIIEGIKFSTYNEIKETIFMTNSRYMNLKNDEPYYNIVNANVNIAVVAQDFDRKDINIFSDNPDDDVASFVMRRALDNYFDKVGFGKFQNEAGEARARYGGVIVKKCYTKIDGETMPKPEVVKWTNIAYVNTNDIDSGIIVEKESVDITEILEKKDIWNNIDEALELFKDKKIFEEVTLYEIHGMLPKKYMQDIEGDYDEDTKEYSRQYHVVLTDHKKHVHLWSEEEDESPYKYKAYIEVDGRDLGMGVVESNKWAQISINDAVLGEREAFALGRKVMFKTNSKTIADNALSEVDNGHIFKLKTGEDINILNTITGNLPEFSNLISKWQTQADRSVAITDALRGETPPSGQAYKLGALVTQQSASSFDYLAEGIAFLYEDICRDWIMPYLIKKYNKKGIITSDLFSAEELIQLDTKYATKRANDIVKKQMLEGKHITQDKYNQLIDGFKRIIGSTNTRTLEIDEEGLFKGYEGRVRFMISNETKNKLSILESLSKILSDVASNPAILTDPSLRQIFGRILELSGAGISLSQLSPAQVDTAGSIPETQKSTAQPLPGPRAVTA